MPGASFSVPRLIGWGIMALGGILLLSVAWRVFLAMWRRFQPLNVWTRYAEESSPFRRRRSRLWGLVSGLMLCLLGIALGALGYGFLALEDRSREYLPFPPDQVVAHLQCSPDEAGAEMHCALDIQGQQPFTVSLAGIRWGLEGEVLAWDPALEGLDLTSGYRLVRLLGYDMTGQVVDEVVLPSRARGLGPAGNWLDGRLPLVRLRRQIAPGEAAPDTFYLLTVSRDGFALQKREYVQPR